MRLSTQLTLLPFIMGFATPSVSLLGAQHQGNVPVSVRWHRLVPSLVEESAARRRAARAAALAAGDSSAARRIAQTPEPFLFTVYTQLGVAQYNAVRAAKSAGNISASVAVASASAVVLTDLFKDSTVRASIARELARDVERVPSGSRARAQQLGEDVANRVIRAAPKLSLMAPWNGTIPRGPGIWYSAPGLPPIGIALASIKGWLLDSASEFRPPAPPAFGSPAWNAALAEVQRVARERTREQTAIAQKWNSGDPWAVWNATAAEAIVRHHMSELDAARVLAVLNVGATDAIIACFDAKYHYWSIRPSQADTTLVLADSVQLPNFPSYPSGHACSAGAFERALVHFFPQERAQWVATAAEQAMSRLYGGIHYRFDNDGGLALGRVVAQNAIDREKRGALVIRSFKP